MKSTWFGNRDRYDFARLIAEADHSVQPYELFRLFLEVCCGTFEQAANKVMTGKACDTIEAEVIRAQKRVKHPEKFSQALNVLVDGIAKDPSDFLGMVFMEVGANDVAFRGQCFTPSGVCSLMAEMTLASVKPKPGETLMLNEPACGAGAMLIATSLRLRDNGFGLRDYLWHAIDVDWKCYAMTYIQTTLLSIPAVVHHGNTLTMVINKSRRNLISAMHPERRRQSKPVEAETEYLETEYLEEVLELEQRTVTQGQLF